MTILNLLQKNRGHSLRTLHGKAKLQYLFDYYKLPFVLVCIAAYMIVYPLYGHFTRKTAVLYLAFANVNVGAALSDQLLQDYISYRNFNTKTNEVYAYQDFYITDHYSDENVPYAYASSTKLLAAIDSRQLDVVILNDNALASFIQNEYLLDLTQLSLPSMTETNDTKFAIDISDTPYFQEAGFTDHLYLGVIANSPRMEEVLQYIKYICN